MGDACDSGGGGGGSTTPTALSVAAGDDITVIPENCTEYTLQASADASATFTWSISPAPSVGFVDNGDGTATFTALEFGASTTYYTVTATGTPSSSDYTTNTDSLTITVPPITTSSGAALPDADVTIRFDDSMPADWDTNAEWTQISGPNVAGFPQTGGTAAFVAPDVTATTELVFSVQTTGCTGQTITGEVSVSVQTANVTLSLPDTIVLSACDTVDPDPGICDPGHPDLANAVNLINATDVTDAPASFSVLYFLEGNGGSDADARICQCLTDGTGTVTFDECGNNDPALLWACLGDGETVNIIVRVFGTAGEIGSASDSIEIVTAP